MADVITLKKRPFGARFLSAYRMYRRVKFGRVRAAYYAWSLARL